MAREMGRIDEAYFDRPKRNKTWSGIEVDKVYSPANTKQIHYEDSLNDPGRFPLTRGIYPEMFRGRYWSSREICGYSSPAATSRRLYELVKDGESALNVIGDLPTMIGIDSDHPFAEGTVGVSGVPVCSYQDMEILTNNIPLEKVSFMLTIPGIIQTTYFTVAQARKIPAEYLKGTSANASCNPICIYGPKEDYIKTIAWKIRCSIDLAEWYLKNTPLWNGLNVNSYVIREGGCTAADEIAISFSEASQYIDWLLERGLTIDEIAPKLTFTMTCHIDFFEEVAKFRAARRLWAHLMRDTYKAQNPKSWRLKYHVNTAGCSLEHKQPLNNIMRVTLEALSAVLGGAQSLQTCSYDEGINIPTKEAQRLAVRTQQIIAHETGVCNVADPLGGSYYVEWLTNKIEEEIRSSMTDIKTQGGFFKAFTKGWIERKVREASYSYQKEVESKERIIVGTNEYTQLRDEEGEVPYFVVCEADVKEHLDNLKTLRRTRKGEKVAQKLEALHKIAQNHGANLTVPIMEAAKAGATSGELMGVIRMAYGYPYDPYNELKCPF